MIKACLPFLDRALVEEALTMRLSLPAVVEWDLPFTISKGVVHYQIQDLDQLGFLLSAPDEIIKAHIEKGLKTWLRGAKDAEKASPNSRSI